MKQLFPEDQLVYQTRISSFQLISYLSGKADNMSLTLLDPFVKATSISYSVLSVTGMFGKSLLFYAIISSKKLRSHFYMNLIHAA